MLIKTAKRVLDCKLTPEERGQRSDESHNLLAMIEEKEREKDAHKEQAKGIGAVIEEMNGRMRTLSGAARTGTESRNVNVDFLYAKEAGEVRETRDDTAEVLVTRRPTADEWDRINRLLQQELPLSDEHLFAPPPDEEDRPPATGPVTMQTGRGGNVVLADSDTTGAARAMGRMHAAVAGKRIAPSDLCTQLGLGALAIEQISAITAAYDEGFDSATDDDLLERARGMGRADRLAGGDRLPSEELAALFTPGIRGPELHAAYTAGYDSATPGPLVESVKQAAAELAADKCNEQGPDGKGGVHRFCDRPLDGGKPHDGKHHFTARK